MREKVEYFTADYRDGRVHIGGQDILLPIC